MKGALPKRWRDLKWRENDRALQLLRKDGPHVVRVPIDLARLHQQLVKRHNSMRLHLPLFIHDHDDDDDDDDVYAHEERQREDEARRLANNLLFTLSVVCRSSCPQPQYGSNDDAPMHAWMDDVLRAGNSWPLGLVLPVSLLLPLMAVGPVLDPVTHQVFVPQLIGDLPPLLGPPDSPCSGPGGLFMTDDDSALTADHRSQEHRLRSFFMDSSAAWPSYQSSCSGSPWWMLSLSPRYQMSVPISPSAFGAMDVQLFESFRNGCLGSGPEGCLAKASDAEVRGYLHEVTGAALEQLPQSKSGSLLPRMSDVVGLWSSSQQRQQWQQLRQQQQKQKQQELQQDSPNSDSGETASVAALPMHEQKARFLAYFGKRQGFLTLGRPRSRALEDLLPFQHAAEECTRLLTRERECQVIAVHPLLETEAVCRLPLLVPNITRLAAIAWRHHAGDFSHPWASPGAGQGGGNAAARQQPGEGTTWLSELFKDCKPGWGGRSGRPGAPIDDSDPVLCTCAHVFGYCLQQRVAGVQALHADAGSGQGGDGDDLARALAARTPAELLWLPSMLAELVNSIVSFRLHVSNGQWLQVIPVLPEHYAPLPPPPAAARAIMARVAEATGVPLQQVHVDPERCRSPGPEENPDLVSKWWTLKAEQHPQQTPGPQPDHEALHMAHVVSLLPCPVPAQDSDRVAVLLHERWGSTSYVPAGARQLCAYAVLEQALGGNVRATVLKCTEY